MKRNVPAEEKAPLELVDYLHMMMQDASITVERKPPVMQSRKQSLREPVKCAFNTPASSSCSINDSPLLEFRPLEVYDFSDYQCSQQHFDFLLNHTFSKSTPVDDLISDLDNNVLVKDPLSKYDCSTYEQAMLDDVYQEEFMVPFDRCWNGEDQVCEESAMDHKLCEFALRVYVEDGKEKDRRWEMAGKNTGYYKFEGWSTRMEDQLFDMYRKAAMALVCFNYQCYVLLRKVYTEGRHASDENAEEKWNTMLLECCRAYRNLYKWEWGCNKPFLMLSFILGNILGISTTIVDNGYNNIGTLDVTRLLFTPRVCLQNLPAFCVLPLSMRNAMCYRYGLKYIGRDLVKRNKYFIVVTQEFISQPLIRSHVFLCPPLQVFYTHEQFNRLGTIAVYVQYHYDPNNTKYLHGCLYDPSRASMTMRDYHANRCQTGKGYHSEIYRLCIKNGRDYSQIISSEHVYEETKMSVIEKDRKQDHEPVDQEFVDELMNSRT